MKNIIQWIKALHSYFISGSYTDKHDCMSNREVIDHIPQYGKTINGHDAHLGDGYIVKCNICGKNWFQNYP